MAAAISFKKAYITPIQEGEKTTTIRGATALMPGDVVNAFCRWGQPPFATLKVTEVRHVYLSELTDEIAQADGFRDLKELRAALRDLYGRKRRFCLISFDRLD